MGQPGGRTGERLDRLMDAKDGLSSELNDLEAKMDRMARSSRGEQMETSRSLQEAAEWIRDSRLSDKVRYSKGVVQERDPRYASSFEEGIGEDLADLERRIDEAAGALKPSSGDRLAEALDDTGDLVRKLESFEDRAREANESEGDRRLGERPGDSDRGETSQESQRGQGGQEGSEAQGDASAEQGSDGGGQGVAGGRLQEGLGGGSAKRTPRTSPARPRVRRAHP